MSDTRAQAKVPQLAGMLADPPNDLIEVARVAGAHGVRGWVKVLPFAVDSTVLESVKTWWLSPPQRTLDGALERVSGRAGQSAQSPGSPGRAVGSDAVPKRDSLQCFRVVWSKAHGSTWLACLKGLADRDQADQLKGASVWVSRSEFPKLGHDEFYWIDLVGCEVLSVDPDIQASGSVASDADRLPSSTAADGQVALTSDPVRIGIVDHVQDNPAHPLLCIMKQHRDADNAWVPSLDSRGRPELMLVPFVAAHVLSVDIESKRVIVDWPSDF